MADLVYEEYKFYEFSSIAIASAIIGVARKVLDVENVWNQHM